MNSARLKKKNEPINPIATESGWHKFGQGYTDADIAEIEDVAGASADRNITSVPSPLAQMHVYDDAFEFVDSNRNDNTSNKNTIFHKLVSQCLDIWEIVFTFNAHPGLDFEIWNKTQSIFALQNSNIQQHVLLGNTLDLYFNKSVSPNINSIQEIFMLSYNGQFFAGTSPFTGFFLSANEIKLPFKNNKDIPYFSLDTELKDRGKEFQLFIAKFVRAHQDTLNTYFTNFYNYVLNNLKSSDYATQIAAIMQSVYTPANFATDYSNPVVNSNGVSMFLNYNMNGRPFSFTMPNYQINVDATCQFIIKPTKPITDSNPLNYPLVLKEGVSGIFLQGQQLLRDYHIPIDIVDENGDYIPVNSRKLPIYNTNHPFLTSGDFLEEYLVELDYALNDKAFICGNTIGFGVDEFNFLLPIKPLYFDYFTMEDLMKNLEIKKNGYEIIVTLKVPVSNIGSPFISLERKYQQKDSYFPSISQIRKDTLEDNCTKGVGHIITSYFGMTLYPFLKVTNSNINYNDFYEINLVQRSNEDPVNFTFHKMPTNAAPININPNDNIIAASENDRYRGVNDALIRSNYYLLKNEFDFISIEVEKRAYNQKISGLIFPKWVQKGLGSVKFDIAVDFGTSNSYVAYRMAGTNAQSFDISEADLQIVRLDKAFTSPQTQNSITAKYEGNPTSATAMLVTEIQREQDTPSVMGIEKDSYNMPFQSVMMESKKVVGHTEINSSTANIPFAISKYSHNDKINNIYTNIKWDNPQPNSPEAARLDVFFEQLLYMVRNKILLNGGNPSISKFIWFKPISMSPFQINYFNGLWQKALNSIFKSSVAPICITESEAPFYVHQATGAIQGNDPVLSIDIGGGTTDILIFKENTPLYSTSSLMASRVMFGDYLSRAFTKNNPIVKYYTPKIQTLVEEFIQSNDANLQAQGLQTKAMLSWHFSPSANSRSEDVISLYFSRPELKFAEMLSNQNSPFKMAFLFYFASIHYNCALYLKENGLSLPRHICMSGNGSKMMNILDAAPNSRNSNFSKFITEIYKSVLQKEVEYCIEIHTTPQPKKATAKGGLWKEEKQLTNEATPKLDLGEKLYLDGNQVTSIPSNYEALKKCQFKAQGSNFYEFVDLFTGAWNDKMNYNQYFGVKGNLVEIKRLLKVDSNVESDYAAGLNKRLEMSDLQHNIAEPVFFYPVIGAISKLLDHLQHSCAN